jgi:hypothetical protein
MERDEEMSVTLSEKVKRLSTRNNTLCLEKSLMDVPLMFNAPFRNQNLRI